MWQHTKSVKKALRNILSIISVALLSAGYAHADNLRPFDGQSFAQIKEEFSGKPFVLSLWSIDCAPCRVELKLLGEIKQKDPDFPLVVISTDLLEDREEALDILDSYDLAGFESWMFADAFVEKLRFSIDPLWHGELPRSYFFAQDHSFKAHSGVLSRDQLQEFFPHISD
ncbi:MAG: TlpA family protein disulfide reductase [Gammaproteobacteria bacterium]